MNDLELVFAILQGTLPWQPFLVLSASIHRIGFACHSVDGSVRHDVQLLRWMQVNQLTDSMDAGEPVS